MKTLKIFLALVVCVAFFGCATGQKTTTTQMYSGPNFDAGPEKLYITVFSLNPELDVADSAFLQDYGIDSPSMSWKVAVWTRGQIDELVAVRVENGSTRFLLITSTVEIPADAYIGVIDHAGKRIYNQKGRYIMTNWRKIKPENYGQFLTKAVDAKFKPLAKGSKEYNDIVELHKKFRVAEVKQLQAVGYQLLGVPVGTVLTKSQINMLGENKWYNDRLKRALMKDWTVMFTLPLMSPVAYGSYIFVSKLFDVSSLWWTEDPNTPGYMDRQLTAVQGYRMIRYYDQNYGRVGGSEKTVQADSGSNLLPVDLKKKLKEKYGKEFNTYEEYNSWALDQRK